MWGPVEDEKQRIRLVNKTEEILKRLKSEGSIIEKEGFIELDKKRIKELYYNQPWIRFGKGPLKNYIKVRGGNPTTSKGRKEIEKAHTTLFGPSKQQKEKELIIGVIFYLARGSS